MLLSQRTNTARVQILVPNAETTQVSEMQVKIYVRSQTNFEMPDLSGRILL